MGNQMEHNGNGGLFAAIISTLIYIISIFSLQAWASFAAIFAGFAAGLYNGYKFIELIKKRKRDATDKSRA